MEEKSGFYTVDADSLYQSSRKPSHLEKRFKKDFNFSNSNKKKQVESKREAILEERRKKLNQNFLKVKRIVNETKNKREDKFNLLAKSLELAEMNRNLYIEQRRANSKQVVERAKHIALQNQRRSELEQERRRAELERRLEKTEERRLAHLNRYKKQQKKNSNSITSSCNNNNNNNNSMHTITSVLSPPLPPTAPKKKPSSWSIILKAFRELNLPSPSSPNTWLGFNSLGKLLNQPKVIVVTTKVLNTGLKIVDENSRSRARVLLTSYMMLMCPREVLQDVNGTEEKALHSSAKQMLHLFEIWLRAHGRPGATVARLAFVNAWNDYNFLFENWKLKDCEHLVKNMIKYYVELSTLRQTVIAQQSGDESVGEQLKQQLEEIKTKLEKLGGNSALERLQRSLESASSSTSTGRRRQERINTPRSPTLEEQDTSGSQTSPEQMARLLSGYAQPSAGLTNEQLAHELIMDPEFKLQRYEPIVDLEKRVTLMAQKAYFDKITEDIQNGTPEKSLPQLIREVKNRLLSLVRSGTSAYRNIDEGIDLDLIEQEIRQKSFDMQRMIDYVLDTASSMCAPVRDEEIRKAREANSMIEQLKQIFTILEDMSLDLANFRLRSLRPHLMSISVEYEREKFAQMLNDGTIQLVRTKSWLNKSADTLCQVAARRNPEQVQPSKNNKPTHDAVFEDALVSLLSQSEPITAAEALPETLALDARRMADFQNEVQAITIVAALLMLARNFGSASAQTLTDLAATLFAMLQEQSTSIDQLSKEIERAVNVKPERKEMVRTMVDKTVSHSDTVYSLILRRIGSVIKSTIQNNTFVKDAVLSSNGLEHVRTNLQSLCIKIQRLVRHNKKVYSTWYDEIIKEALDKHIQDTTTA